MTKRVVGWHFHKQPARCGYCGKIGTTVLVFDDTREHDYELESCDECTPPHSCPDEIAEAFNKMTPRKEG